jgi:hypothetical protein
VPSWNLPSGTEKGGVNNLDILFPDPGFNPRPFEFKAAVMFIRWERRREISRILSK